MVDNPALWWLGLGLALLLLEVLTGTLFCLWLSAAAFATALLSWLVWPSLAAELVVFSLASFVCTCGWVYFRPRRIERHEAAAALNNRVAACIGREVVLAEPIVNGRGRINIDDSWWQVRGEDLPAGSRVHVESAEGMVLLVRPAA